MKRKVIENATVVIDTDEPLNENKVITGTLYFATGRVYFEI